MGESLLCAVLRMELFEYTLHRIRHQEIEIWERYYRIASTDGSLKDHMPDFTLDLVADTTLKLSSPTDKFKSIQA